MLNYSDLGPEMILSKFPELQKNVEEEIVFWEGDDIPNHCLYGNVFNHYLCDLLKEYRNIAMIQRIFDFYEYLATEGDREIKNLIQVTLLEVLWDDVQIYKRALSFMGSNTLEINFKNLKYMREPQ